jgi:hypothetical protein
MIFARKIDDPLIGLIKKINEATARYRGIPLESCVIFSPDDGPLTEALKILARKQNIKHTILATAMRDTYRYRCKLAPEADVTVLLYVGYKVQASHAFRQGELNGKDVEKIAWDLSKILLAR